MGGAGSVPGKEGPQGSMRRSASSVPSVSQLPAPVVKQSSTLFSVLPMDENFRAKSSTMLLEVSDTGFRLLQPASEDALFLFPWGQIHSWAHTSDKFSFRFFLEREKRIDKYSFQVRDVNQLMETIQEIIDRILGDRKSQAICDEEFEQLTSNLQEAETSDRLPGILSATKLNYFTALQGQRLVCICEAAFDKVEAAAALHPRLVDQNRFNLLLDVLECTEDKENVWHRLSAFKRQNSRATSSRS